MIPIKYNVRNLRVRWKTTLLTVLATGLVVWSSCILFGMVEGLEYSLTISGDPLDLIVLRKGSSSEVGGGFLSAKADEILNLPGIASDGQGHPGRQGAAQHPSRRAHQRHPHQYHFAGRSASLAQASPGLQDRRRQRFRRRARANAS